MKGEIVLLGLLCISVGIFLWIYSAKLFGYVTVYPYSDEGFILSIVGIIIIVVGLAFPEQKQSDIQLVEIDGKSRTPSKIVLLPVKSCPKCGKRYSGTLESFCPTCGVKLESI